jgi:hypothetical protein
MARQYTDRPPRENWSFFKRTINSVEIGKMEPILAGFGPAFTIGADG